MSVICACCEPEERNGKDMYRDYESPPKKKMMDLVVVFQAGFLISALKAVH